MLGVGQSGEDRLTVKFTKAVFRDGNVQSIEAQAADVEDQTVGLTGSKVGKYATKYASAVGLNFVGGMAEGIQDREIVGQQVLTKPNAKNALLNGASKAALEMANETMTDLKNSNPAIHVPAGQEIFKIEANEIKRFHTDANDCLQIHYYSQVLAHAGLFAVPLLESIIEQLSLDCSDSDKQRLGVLKQTLAWQRTLGGMRL